MQWIISFWYQLSELEHGSHNNIPCMDIVPYIVERCYNAAQHNMILYTSLQELRQNINQRLN